MIASLPIFLFGIFFNLYVTAYCFHWSRWRSMNNLKYFVVFQTIVNSGNLLSHLVLMLRDELRAEHANTRDHAICDTLPNITALLMSLSVFNLTAFIVVRYLKIERRWSFSTVKITLTFLAILLSTAALLYPALSYFYLEMPVIKCNGCYCPSPGVSWEANFDVCLYGYMFVMLQFVVPAVILLCSVFRAVARHLENSRPLKARGRSICILRCDLKNINIATLGTFLVIIFSLPVRGIRFVGGESLFSNNVSPVEIELLNSVFYVLEVLWACVTAFLPFCLKHLTDNEILGQRILKTAVQSDLYCSQRRTYYEAFEELELWE